MNPSALIIEWHDWHDSARVCSATRSRVVLVHALRNALIPVVTVAGFEVGYLIAGAAVVETIFNLPGVGNLVVMAVKRRDYPLVQGCILFIAVTYVAMNVLVDLAYGWLDPRIRLR